MQALALLALLQFQFPTEPLDYRVLVRMEGFLPILGGNEGKVEADLGLRVTRGKSVVEDKTTTLIHEISASKLKFDGEELPLGLEQVQEFFPKTTLKIDQTGKVLSTDAPDKATTIRLPGLDARRLADVTFLPVIFPPKQVSEGDAWTFAKTFGESDVTYTCKVVSLTEDVAKISVETAQTYTVFENEALEVVRKKEDAVNEVTTTLVGKGEVTFNRRRGVTTKFVLSTDSVRKSKDVKTDTKTDTKLRSNFEVNLVEKS